MIQNIYEDDNYCVLIIASKVNDVEFNQADFEVEQYWNKHEPDYRQPQLNAA